MRSQCTCRQRQRRCIALATAMFNSRGTTSVRNAPVSRNIGRFGASGREIETEEDKTVAVLTFENGAFGTLNTTACAFGGALNREASSSAGTPENLP